MATYTLKKTNGDILTSAPVAYGTAIPASTKGRFQLIDLENIGQAPARIWVWVAPSGASPSVAGGSSWGVDLRQDAPSDRLHTNADAYSLINAAGPSGILARGQGVNLASKEKQLATGEQIYAMTNYARYALATANIFSSTEVVSTALTSTYDATHAIDSALAQTASPNNADNVGKRVQAGNAYLIITSNTATSMAGTDGWRDQRTGLPTATPTNATSFTILASLRDIGDAAGAVPQDLLTGHLINCNAKSGIIVGNNLSIAIYGTTYQVARDRAGTAGGWSGGTNPGNGNAYQIDALVRLLLDWIEESP